MSGSIVALAMYDWPEVQAANDDLWSFLAGKLHAAGFAAPSALDRSGDYWEPWRSPHLLMAQTCGYPFATVLRGHVRLIGTPCYGVPGCQGPDYSSVIVANRRSGLNNLKDLKKCTAAINSLTSQSGYWALRAAIASTDGAAAPALLIQTGSHRESLRQVAGGEAHIAAIDPVCFALARRYEAEAVAQLRTIAWSPAAPGLPVISAPATPDAVAGALGQAWTGAVADASLAGVRGKLFLSGFEPLKPADYDRILDIRRIALALPFPEPAA